MTDDELINALRRVSTQDGLRCLGCGYEHNCGIHGSAVIREGIQRLGQMLAQIQALEKETEKARSHHEL